jgi:hypothetical protein
MERLLMTAVLAVRTGLPGSLRADGYDLPPDLTYDEWRSVVALAEYIHAASPWWLGDALVYGERRFPETHAQALPTAEEDPHGARQSRMKQAVWVSSKFPPVTRVTGLSWSHHRAAAELELPAARSLLREAAEKNLPTRALIARVKQEQEATRGTAVDEPPVALPLSAADLTDEAREALSYRLAGVGARHRTGYERGFLEALRWGEVRDAFTRWED